MTQSQPIARTGDSADTAAVLALFDRAAIEAIERGTPLLRVDCWAGGDGALVRYYERAGFTPTERFTVGEWPGPILARQCD